MEKLKWNHARDLTMIFAAKICEKTYRCNKRVVKQDGMQGLSAIPTQEKKIQQRKESHCWNYSQGTKGAEGVEDRMQPVGMQPPKQQQKKAVSANQMEKQRLKSYLRWTLFQQKKRGEELANGMDINNTAMEQLSDKVKEGEIIMATAKAAGDEGATWAAKCAEQEPKFPSRTLCYSVGIFFPP